MHYLDSMNSEIISRPKLGSCWFALYWIKTGENISVQWGASKDTQHEEEWRELGSYPRVMQSVQRSVGHMGVERWCSPLDSSVNIFMLTFSSGIAKEKFVFLYMWLTNLKFIEDCFKNIFSSISVVWPVTDLRRLHFHYEGNFSSHEGASGNTCLNQEDHQDALGLSL